MVLGGLQKNSFIDYPGKISCVLFVSGCNFDCPYCHNPELVKGQFTGSSLIDEDMVFDFLKKRKGFLDGVVISGGEPTLKKGLASFCNKIKRIGYPVKLDTNGSRPRVIKRLVDEGLVDYIAMDIKTDPFYYPQLIKKDCRPDDILSSIRIIMESTMDYEFRTTCVRPFVNSRIMGNIVKNIKGAMLYALQYFQNTGVLHPECFPGKCSGHKEKELIELKSIAEPWVKRCIIR